MEALFIFKSSHPTHLTFTQQHQRSCSRPPLKTYSKRVLKDSYHPSIKKQRVEPAQLEKSPLDCQIEIPVKVVRKKRTISEYFKVTPQHTSPKTSLVSITSSDPPDKDPETPPSSPPPLQNSCSASSPKSRPRRRLTTRPALRVLMNSSSPEKDTSSANKGHKQKPPLPFYPNSKPPRKSSLGKDSPPGLRQAAKGGTTSEEDQSYSDEDQVDHPGAIAISNTRRPTFGGPIASPLDIPFAPSRQHISHAPDAMSFQASDFSMGSADGASPPTHVLANASGLAASDGDLEGTGNGFAPGVQVSDGSGDNDVSMFVEEFEYPDPENYEGNRGNISAQNITPYFGGVAPLTMAQSDLARAFSDEEVYSAVSDDQRGIRAPSSFHQAPSGSAMITSGPQNSQEATGFRLLPLDADLHHQADGAANRSTGVRSTNLVQSSINMGRSTITTCSFCKFTYDTTCNEDRNLHDLQHNDLALGVAVRPLLTDATHNVRIPWTQYEADGHDHIVSIDWRSSKGWKDMVLKVLAMHVDVELGAVATSVQNLWSTITNAITNTTEGKFTAYLYITNNPTGHKMGNEDRIVGLLLAQTVYHGYGVTDRQIQHDNFGPWPQIVPQLEQIVTNVPTAVYMGVNKLWVIGALRHGGRATQLLDVASNNFRFGVHILPTQIAWAPTTESGGRFARMYTNADKEDEFHMLYYTASN